MLHAIASPDRASSRAGIALNEASLEGLVALLSEHYLPTASPFAVDVFVTDQTELSRRFTLGDSVICSRLDACTNEPAARIAMTAAVLQNMLANPTRFDPRSAAMAAHGGVRVEGSQRIAAYWLQLLKRPTPEGAAALERARARTLPLLRDVSTVDARETSAWTQHAVASILAGLPLLIRAPFAWPEANWTLAQWREHEGAVVLRDDPRSGRAQTLGDFIDALAGTTGSTPIEAAYTGGTPIPDAWKGRFRLPQLPQDLFGPAQLWFGARSGETLVTNLHCDLENSFLAQLHGRKRVRLFAPREACNVYALDAFNTYRPCRVDAAAPDLDRFPRFAQACFVDVTIGPGDLLVIPTGWFHCVWATGATLSISRFAGDEAIERYAGTKSSAQRSLPYRQPR